MRTSILIILGVIMAGTGGYISYQLNSPAPEPATTSANPPVEEPAELSTVIVGSPRPPFVLADIDGRQRAISEWDGKVLVLNFWATWCPPCREEIPEFVHLQEKYAADGVQFIGIAPESAEDVRSFAVEFAINYPLLVGQSAVIEISEEYGNDIGALPYTVIVDRSGRIARLHRGPLSTAQAEEAIQSLL